MSKTEWAKLDITNDELNRLTNALKSEKFRNLFIEYCQELSDPENHRIYEEELKQLEAERGYDVKFIKPEAGFVIKTSADEHQKVFINVAKCEKIDKPSSQCGVDKQTGEKGLNWRIPYVQSKPKHDFDKNKQICAVFDVIFHPHTLHLADKNAMFKKLVIETACDAVCDAFDIKLDRCNLKFPKMSYKGVATPAILRNKFNDDDNDDICTKLPETIASDKNDSADEKCVVIENKNCNNDNNNKNNQFLGDYETPKYEVIHRRHVELHELTNELDAKLNITLPKELIIKINLPLLNSSKNVILDVNTKSLYLCCDTPAKYKLEIDLPYEVDKKCGTAQFDANQKMLIIALPVLKRKELGILDLCREDSGVESDHHSPKEDDDEVFEDACDSLTDIEIIQSNNRFTKTEAEDLESLDNKTFLDESISYILPHFTYNRFENVVAFTLHVKNVEPDSIVAMNNKTRYHVKFSSIGSGFFKNHYSFYFQLPANAIAIVCQPQAEAWENNVVIQITLDSIDNFHSYRIGLTENDCKDFVCAEKKIYSGKKHNDTDISKENKMNYVKVETAISNKELQIEITTNKKTNSISSENEQQQSQTPSPPHQQPQQHDNQKKSKHNNKKTKQENKKARSYSESHCDAFDNHKNTQNHLDQAFSLKGSQSNPSKLRTQSESSNDDHHLDLFPLKSILKRHSSYDRTTSEHSLHEDVCSVSTDMGIGSFKSIPEEKDLSLSESVKKTVRFDKQLCRKLLFRMNSTIVGQRKPKEDKRKKKKRNQDRRCSSEGEASDYEINHSNPRCKNGNDTHESERNKMKYADAKNNLIFDIEI